MINQRVVAKDRYGNVINSAQIQVGLVDSQGYILLDASDIFVPGTVHVFDRNPGSAASGQVTIDSDGVEITGGKLSVVNPSGTVIIDGTSNMFKIRTGYLCRQNTMNYLLLIPHRSYFQLSRCIRRTLDRAGMEQSRQTFSRIYRWNRRSHQKYHRGFVGLTRSNSSYLSKVRKISRAEFVTIFQGGGF